GGMALLQDRLARSERVVIAVESAGQPLHIPAQVRHCRQLGNGVVELGCQFQVPGAVRLSGPPPEVEAAVGLLLARAASRPAPDRERRAHPRVAYTEAIEVCAGPAAPPTRGFARDLSRGGISFVTTTPLLLAPCVLLLPQGDGPPLRLRAEV